MSESDAGSLRTALPSLTTEAAASRWLIDRLASGERGETLSMLSAADETELVRIIIDLHARLRGVGVSDWGTETTSPTGSPRTSPTLKFVSQYASLAEHFSGAILMARQSGN